MVVWQIHTLYQGLCRQMPDARCPKRIETSSLPLVRTLLGCLTVIVVTRLGAGTIQRWPSCLNSSSSSCNFALVFLDPWTEIIPASEFGLNNNHQHQQKDAQPNETRSISVYTKDAIWQKSPQEIDTNRELVRLESLKLDKYLLYHKKRQIIFSLKKSRLNDIYSGHLLFLVALLLCQPQCKCLYQYLHMNYLARSPSDWWNKRRFGPYWWLKR